MFLIMELLLNFFAISWTRTASSFLCGGPYIVRSSAVRYDVDLVWNDSVVGPSTEPLVSHDVLVPPDDLCDSLQFICIFLQ